MPWHYWMGVVLFISALALVGAVIIGYLKVVVAPTYQPSRRDPPPIIRPPEPACASVSAVAPQDEYDATSEMRFAIVLYGGVSLAIYMNGIVQELLALVRATAPDSGTGGGLHVTELSGAEPVYRELGRRLDRGAVGPEGPGPVRTRFVVDLITGTSAGGINGVFLAKALANDQSLDALSQLWVEEGDIAGLLNDGRAKDGLSRTPVDKPPLSLLSGQRMLFKLIQAMRTVSTKPSAEVSPYADAIDLWVTATDLSGRAEGVEFADPDKRGGVYELNFRTAFHFLYERNDAREQDDPPRPTDPAAVEDPPVPSMFADDYDPLLAFAARCTSSFPAAFAPSQLTDVGAVLENVKKTSDGTRLPPLVWSTSARRVKGLFQKYGDVDRYETVSFADGGYLDNNPVDLVLNTLPKRRASMPVTRRVLIVDPDPGTEPSPDASPKKDRVDLVSTLIKVVSLPRQQTIGSDVARIRALGEPAAMRKKLYAKVDEFVDSGAPRNKGPATPSSIAYSELRRLSWMRDVASVLARVGYDTRSYDDESRQYRLLVDLIASWRQRSPQRFAARSAIDLAFDLRQINFLQRRIDESMRQPGLDPASATFRKGKYLREVLDKQYLALARAGRRIRYRNDNPAELQLDALRNALRELDEGIVGLTPQLLAVFRAQQALDDVLVAFNDYLQPVTKRVRRRVKDALKDKEQLAQYRNWWGCFEVYDQATYVLHEALPGENEDIEVHRISPRDATALVDERADDIPKLAGAQVHHFGAFFAADWRRNDILWGRLDAAERIIAVAWPDQVDKRGRDALVTKAQRAIIEDALQDKEYRRLLSRLLDGGTLPDERPTDSVAIGAEVDQVIDGYRRRYAPPPPPSRTSTLQLAARVARVTEGVGTGLSRDRANRVTSALGWTGRVLRVVANLIELALGQQPWDIVRNLVNLTVFASIVIIVLGAVIGGAGVVGFGWAVLAASVGLKLLAETIRAWAERKRWWLLPLALLAATVVLAYEWVKSVDGTRGSLGLVAVGAAAGFLLTSRRKGGWRLLPVVLAVAVLVSLAAIGLRHDRQVLIGHVCDANHSWWEDGPKWIPTVTCPTPPTP